MAVVVLRAEVYPYLVRGVESTRRMISEPPPGEQWVAYVAELDGRPVGWASSYLNAKTSEPTSARSPCCTYTRPTDGRERA